MDYIFICLHCLQPFVVAHNEFNCRIMRHGVFRHNLQPINPHSSKEECDKLVTDGIIYGCSRPLQIVDSSDGYQVIICDYI